MTKDKLQELYLYDKLNLKHGLALIAELKRIIIEQNKRLNKLENNEN